MCCLNHEEETYENLNKNLPHVGDRVICPDGVQGEVSSVNVLRQLVKVVVEKGDSKEIHEYKAGEIRFVRRGHRQVREEVSAEELRALELMEKQDKMDSETEEKPAKGQRKERPNREERQERENKGERKERVERENKGERSDRKHRDRKERLQPTEQPLEQKEEAPSEGGRNRKRNYYRNRRRNRPEGAKEQHES